MITNFASSILFGYIDPFVAWFMPHFVILPMAIPLLTSALMLGLRKHHRKAKTTLAIASSLITFIVALALLRWICAPNSEYSSQQIPILAYLIGNWDASIGISLVADRLSVLMLIIFSAVSLVVVIYSASRWKSINTHFYSLLQLLLVGLNGSVLTADLFNLFVFFEITVVTSYGLMLNSFNNKLIKYKVRYVIIHFVASALFLLGTALMYGAAGTMNLAELAHYISKLDLSEFGLIHSATIMLFIACFIASGIWPVNFWIANAYSVVTYPVGATLALLPKLGIYIILRLWTLLFSLSSERYMLFGQNVIIMLGIATLILGTLGLISTQRRGLTLGFLVLISSGTVITAIGLGQPLLWAGMLYYFVSSALAITAFFLLMGIIDRWQKMHSNGKSKIMCAPFINPSKHLGSDINFDDNGLALYAKPIAPKVVFLGGIFMLCSLLLANAPPLPGFIGSFAMLSSALQSMNLGSLNWTFVTLLAISSFITLITLLRLGMRLFWQKSYNVVPYLPKMEILSISLLLCASLLLIIISQPAVQYTRYIATDLLSPQSYHDAIKLAKPKLTFVKNNNYTHSQDDSKASEILTISSKKITENNLGESPNAKRNVEIFKLLHAYDDYKARLKTLTLHNNELQSSIIPPSKPVFANTLGNDQ